MTAESATYGETDALKESDHESPFLREGIGRFKDRLSEVIDSESVRAFSKRSGVSEGSLRNCLDGGGVTLESLLKIADAANVTVQWLATGEGPMRPGEPSQAAPPPTAPPGQPLGDFELVPLYDVEVAAGDGRLPSLAPTLQNMAFRRDWLRSRGLSPASLALVTARGDSMEPTISDRDVLMVDRNQTDLCDGAIYVIRFDGHLVVKRVQMLMNRSLILISDNKMYRELELSPAEAADLQVIGRVIWIGKDM